MDINEVAHALGKFPHCPLLGDLYLAPRPVRVEEDKQINLAIAPVLIVVASRLAGRSRDRLPHFADELGRALVEADHRPLRIRRFSVKIKYILHAGDIGAIYLRNAPHVLTPGLQLILCQASAHRLAGQPTVIGEPDHLTSQQLKCPACASLRRAGAGGGNQKRLLLARQLARRCRARLFAQSQFEIAFDEPALGAVDGGLADTDTGSNRGVSGSAIGSQQDLGAFQLACGMMTATQHRDELITFRLAQLDAIPYIHRRPPMFEGTTHESRSRAGSRLVETALHTEAGTVSGIHPRLYAGARSAARRSRFAAPLSRHTAIRAPDAHHSRARGTYPAPARHRTQHTIADRSRHTAAVIPQPTSISQNRCARVLVRPHRGFDRLPDRRLTMP